MVAAGVNRRGTKARHIDALNGVIAANELLQFLRGEESHPSCGDQVAEAAQKGMRLSRAINIQLAMSNHVDVTDGVCLAYRS